MNAVVNREDGSAPGRRITIWAAVLVATPLVLTGCSNRPAAIGQPDFDPSEAGRLAMEQYDTNGDGFVAGEELEKAGSLNSSMKTLDTNGDGQVSAEEVADRVRVWQKLEVGLTTVSCTFELDGKKLTGAEVIFEPEAFLQADLQDAVGETDRYGKAMPVVPKDKRPTPDTPPGLPFGFYKVKVSKKSGGNETIPARYNTDTILGQQISFDDPAVQSNRVIFRLKSN